MCVKILKNIIRRKNEFCIDASFDACAYIRRILVWNRFSLDFPLSVSIYKERIGKKNNKVEIVLYLICQTENDDVIFEMTVEELYELYNDFNDRSPRRSFTRAERKKILRDFAKTCCYEDNICDNKNVDVLCFWKEWTNIYQSFSQSEK